jgi:ribose transport system permease protein
MAIDTRASAARSNRIGTLFAQNRQVPLVGVLIVVCIALTFTTTTFLTGANIKSVILGAAIDLVLVAGQTVVIIGGGFDLSIGSVVGLSAVSIGLLIGAGMPWWLATVIAVLIGGLCGMFNGLLIAKLGISPLIATLGTMFAFQGLALVVTQSATVYATGTPLVDSIGQASWLGMPAPAWISIIILLIFAAIMRWWKFGREVFLVGGNREAARLVGVNVARNLITSYVIMGLLSGIAGALAIGRVGTANATTGANEPLTVIAAVVVGGAALAGGEGSVIGAGLGVILIGLVQNAVVLLNVSVFWQQLVVGAVLIIAVAANVLNSRVRDALMVRAVLRRGDRTLPEGSPAGAADTVDNAGTANLDTTPLMAKDVIDADPQGSPPQSRGQELTNDRRRQE